VRSLMPDDNRVSFGASRKGGPGIARTMALARAQGSLIKTLDADDRLTQGALFRDIEALTAEGADYSWTASRVVDETDGIKTPHYAHDPQQGIIRSGLVYRAYAKENYRILVHPATLCIRYPILIALGGWMALPASEDTGLLMALDSISNGYFISKVGLIYRKWSPQMSASPEHADAVELSARRSLVMARAEALSYLFN
jgi:glycosyltransferase involved in cell wall biosynthesis